MTDPATIALHWAFAGLGGAKALLLAMVIALPAILVIGALLKRSRSR